MVREAANREDAQLNFGVILDESMGDAVKITVIATGVPAETAPAVESHWTAPMYQRPRARTRATRGGAEPEPEAFLMAEAEPPVDLDDLDTPAYLRQGRLLN